MDTNDLKTSPSGRYHLALFKAQVFILNSTVTTILNWDSGFKVDLSPIKLLSPHPLCFPPNFLCCWRQSFVFKLAGDAAEAKGQSYCTDSQHSSYSLTLPSLPNRPSGPLLVVSAHSGCAALIRSHLSPRRDSEFKSVETQSCSSLTILSQLPVSFLLLTVVDIYL